MPTGCATSWVGWWEVDQRAEAEGDRQFPELVQFDDDWKMRHVAPWIALPSPVSAAILGTKEEALVELLSRISG